MIFGNAAHQADTGDAVGQQEHVLVMPVNMDVHVPQAGNQVFTRSVHDFCATGDANLLANFGDTVSPDDHGHVRLGRGACGVNDRHMCDRNWPGLSGRLYLG